jgi:hypothetical protein
MMSAGSCSSTKVGSLQLFESHKGQMDSYGESKVGSVEMAHKIAIMDLRILNADRHGGNILCRENQDGTFQLVPIDHGSSLRSICNAAHMDICWLHWSHMKEPVSQATLDYVLNLDTEADVAFLEQSHILGNALLYFRASSRLLQDGLKAGLSLYAIALCCYRDDSNDPLGDPKELSPLELIVFKSTELASFVLDYTGDWNRSQARDAIVDELSVGSGGRPSFDVEDHDDLTAPCRDWAADVVSSVLRDADGLCDEAGSGIANPVPHLVNGNKEAFLLNFGAFIDLFISEEVAARKLVEEYMVSQRTE